MDQEAPNPTPELPPGATEWGTNLAKVREKQDQAEKAASRTPGVVLDALDPAELRAAGHELHAFTLQTYLNLARLHSPFVEKDKDKEPTIEDIITALWVMVVPDDEVRLAIRRGTDVVEGELSRFATAIPISELGGISTTLSLHLARAFAPTAKLNPPTAEGGAPPLEPVSSATAPAGS